MTRFLPLRSIIFSSATLLSLALTAGCETHPAPDALANSAVVRPVAMSGQSKFFNGKVIATISITRGSGRGGPGGRGGEGPGGGAGRRGGGRSRGGPGGEGPANSETEGSYGSMPHRASPLPTVTIKLNLENQTDQSLEVQIDEVSSDLGNFAVRPEKLTLPARQSGEPDPMFSQLGVTSDVILVKVGLKSAGMSETEVLAVKTISTADAATLAP